MGRTSSSPFTRRQHRVVGNWIGHREGQSESSPSCDKTGGVAHLFRGDGGQMVPSLKIRPCYLLSPDSS